MSDHHLQHTHENEHDATTQSGQREGAQEGKISPWPVVTLVGVELVLIIIFSGDLLIGIRWFTAVAILLGIPGYAFLMWLWPESTALMRIIIAPFAGFGITPFFMFVLSQLGFPAVSVWFALVSAVVFAILIFISHMMRRRKSHAHHHVERGGGDA